MAFVETVNRIDAFLWGGPLAFLILSLGIYLSFKLNFLQITKLKEAFLSLTAKAEGEGEISPFGALCTALSASIGTGNIIGVASAMAMGGPGALFWMLVSAFFAMPIKYMEGFLAVKYRTVKNKKTFGGPFCYIEKGLGKDFLPLSLFFSVSCILASLLGMGTLTQSNSMAEALTNFLKDWDNTEFIVAGSVSYSSIRVLCAFTAALLTGIIMFGGIKRIARTAEALVPFMAIFYLSICLVIVIGNIDKIPSAIYLVIKSAFAPEAVLGGASGITVREAVRCGVSGGIFSNESGLGTSPIADATAKTESPQSQGLVSMTATFIDTFLICFLTGLSILVTNSLDKGESGAVITEKAFSSGLPFGGEMSSLFLTISLVVFAFTTIIGWSFYGEACLSHITGDNKKALKLYRILYIAAVFSGPFVSVPLTWTLARIFNAFMALPNLIAVFYLSKKTIKMRKI